MAVASGSAAVRASGAGVGGSFPPQTPVAQRQVARDQLRLEQRAQLRVGRPIQATHRQQALTLYRTADRLEHDLRRRGLLRLQQKVPRAALLVAQRVLRELDQGGNAFGIVRTAECERRDRRYGLSGEQLAQCRGQLRVLHTLHGGGENLDRSGLVSVGQRLLAAGEHVIDH